jgi:hypothetical protein
MQRLKPVTNRISAPYLLVLAHQRSGSNHLLDLLRGFVGVTTLGEFFNITASAPGKMHQAEALAQYNGSVEQFRAAAENNPLDTLRFREHVADANLYIMKLFANQLRSERARQILIDNAAGIIHLRRNAFGTWVSRELAKRTGNWFNASSESSLVTFSITSFIRHSSRNASFALDSARMTRESGKPSVELTFSEVSMMSEPRQVADRLAHAFPEIRELTLRDDWVPSVARQDFRLPIDRIDNAEQARAELANLSLDYLLNNNDADDLEDLVSQLAEKPERSALQRLMSAAQRRLGLSAKK